MYVNFHAKILFHLMLLIKGNNGKCKSKKRILLHVLIYLGVEWRYNKMNEGSIHVFLHDHILYLVILCVVLQHNNKLQTIENIVKGRMLLVLDANMLSSALMILPRNIFKETLKLLSLNVLQTYKRIQINC